MTKLLLFTLSLVLAKASFATVVDPIEFEPNSKELVELGIIVEFHTGPVCGNATEIVISIPTAHHGASFSGATLELKDEDDTLLFTNLRHAESHEVAHNTSDSKNLFFCLHPSLHSTASIRLYYSKGQHTTNTIVFGIDAK